MSKKGENIYRRKDGRWEARCKKGVTAEGRILYLYCYGKTYREAKEKLELRKKQIYTGQQSRPSSPSRSLGAYCDEWLFHNRGRRKESTAAKYTLVIEKHIKLFFGGYCPDYLTTKDVDAFTAELTEVKGLSPKTVRDILVILRAVLAYASRFVDSAKKIEVSLPRGSSKEMRILSFEGQKRFAEYLATDMDACKFGILFALMTGLRIGEVCALKISDISLENSTVTVRKTMQRIKNLSEGGPKTKIVFSSPKSDSSARVIPLTNAAAALCRERVEGVNPRSFLLTGSEVRFIEPRVLQYRIKKYSRECGIEDLHFHVLRHTFATRCVEVGFEIKSLSEILGHSTPRITLERYVPSSLEFKRQNMAKLESMGM